LLLQGTFWHSYCKPKEIIIIIIIIIIMEMFHGNRSWNKSKEKEG